MLLELVVGALEAIGAPYAVIGGQAVAMRGHPRLTVDYDFLTADHRVFDRQVWARLEEKGAIVDVRKGDPDDPLAGVVHITLLEERDADVVVAKWKWEQAVIERAEPLLLHGISVPVPRTSDLILLKLAAGGYLDLQDVHALLHAGDRGQLIPEVDQLVNALPADARESWKRIVTSLA
ncbi:MAG TPA: hypothetical protein VGF28_25675 [Thermoanaerobaculia bacterium]|jgi:hypothetical protein